MRRGRGEHATGAAPRGVRAQGCQQAVWAQGCQQVVRLCRTGVPPTCVCASTRITQQCFFSSATSASISFLPSAYFLAYLGGWGGGGGRGGW